MTVREQLEELAKTSEIELMFYDNLDDALMGTVERFGPQGRYVVALYDREKCLEILAQSVEGSPEERHESALEWFEFNVIGGYNGPLTPAFFSRPEG